MLNLYNHLKLFVLEYKKRIVTVIGLIFIFFLATIILLNNKKNDVIVYEDEINEKQTINENLVLENKVVDEIYYVDVKGYVNNPGVYSISKGKRVVDAINIAGGLRKEANTKLLNLSLEISDQMVIVVYSNEEIANYTKVIEEVKQENNICSDVIKNDACIVNSKIDINANNNNNNNSNSAIKEDNDNLTVDDKTKLININTGTLEELMTLPKIGEAKAKEIIEYRESNGLFKTIDEIKNVSGIGDKLFADIKENITV